MFQIGTAFQEFYRVPSFTQYFKYSQILGTRPKFMSPHIFLTYFRETWEVYQNFTPKLYILPPSIFFILKYDNKLHKPVLEMCLKIASAF